MSSGRLPVDAVLVSLLPSIALPIQGHTGCVPLFFMMSERLTLWVTIKFSRLSRYHWDWQSFGFSQAWYSGPFNLGLSRTKLGDADDQNDRFPNSLSTFFPPSV